MSNKLPKYSQCPYCDRDIEKHHCSQHVKKCFMSHHNLKLICDYFERSINNTDLLKRKKFHHYCVEEAKILSPVSMGHYFNQSRFKILVVQLLIMLYQYSMFDWEIAELIIYHITNGKFYMTHNLFCEINRQVRNNRGFNNIDTSQNYDTLINAIINRAKLDLKLVVGNNDENNEIISEDCIIDALLFLNYMKPEEIYKARHEGLMSNDANLLFWQHVGTPDKFAG